MENKSTLTEEEKLFCELYAQGKAPYAGNAAKCYSHAFDDTSIRCRPRSLNLLKRQDIQDYLAELDDKSVEDAKYTKAFLRENLISIIEECSSMQLINRKGQVISPAALRSVAVNASKALMDICPVKEAHVSKLSIDSAAEGGITFNVIMPDQSKVEKKTEEDND